MDDIKFFKFLTLSIINLLSYLFSIYFLVSLYYHDLYFDINLQNKFIKYYKDISISFSFHTISFLAFNISLFIMIIKTLLENEDPNENKDSKEDNLEKINKIILLVIYLVCQFFYFLNLILLSVNYNKIKEVKVENFYRKKFIENIYVELLVIGYIFFVIFLIISIWAYIFTEDKFNFLPYLTDFNFFESFFKKKIRNTPGNFEKQNTKLEEEIKNLEKYKSKLNGKTNSIDSQIQKKYNENITNKEYLDEKNQEDTIYQD